MSPVSRNRWAQRSLAPGGRFSRCDQIRVNVSLPLDRILLLVRTPQVS